MLLGQELTFAIIEKVYNELQQRVDCDDIKKSDVEKWSAIFVEENSPSNIQPEVVDTADFFEYYDH